MIKSNLKNQSLFIEKFYNLEQCNGKLYFCRTLLLIKASLGVAVQNHQNRRFLLRTKMPHFIGLLD